MEKNIKLSVQGLSCTLGGKTVLDDVSFDVREGEFLSILGPSGCGKTTLLRLLLGLETPVRGTILKDGKDITAAPAAARGMGVVFQSYALFENMSVLRGVEYAPLARRENRTREARARVRAEALETLEMLGLSEHKDKKPAALSGGQMQRVAIARALLMHPDVILFDEPMSALDAATRLSLREELLRVKKMLGSTFIYVTHDTEEAFSMSDRILVMNEAEVAQLGTPAEILDAPASDHVKRFVSDALTARARALSALVERPT